MDASIAAIVAQWGGFGAVLLAVGVYAYTLHKELSQARKDHLDEVSKLQSSRVEDAKSVTSTLLNLQKEFNVVGAATIEALQGQERTIEEMRGTMQSLERQIALCDLRRGGAR